MEQGNPQNQKIQTDPKESKNDCVVKEDDSNSKYETIINNTEQIPENVTMTQEAQQNGVDSYYQELSNQIMSSEILLILVVFLHGLYKDRKHSSPNPRHHVKGPPSLPPPPQLPPGIPPPAVAPGVMPIPSPGISISPVRPPPNLDDSNDVIRSPPPFQPPLLMSPQQQDDYDNEND